MKKSIAILACAALLCGCAPKADNGNAATETEAAVENAVEAPATGGLPANGTVHELTDATLYTPGVKVSNLTVLDFNAVWCGPCRQLAPVLEELAKEYEGRVTFVSIDVDTFGSLFESFNMGQSIPAVLVIRPDGSTQKYVGTGDLLPAEKFRAIIDSNLC